VNQYTSERDTAITIASEAAREIRRIYDAKEAQTYIKADASPVTDADLASDRIIRERIAAAFPGDAILTEEGADDAARLTAQRCWIVDPIDGTQQFVDRTGQFDVLIALVVDGRPVVSVMAQPVTGLILAAAAGAGATIGLIGSETRNQLVLRQPGPEPVLATTIWFGAPASAPYLARFAAAAGVAMPKVLPTGVLIRGHVDPIASGMAADPVAFPPANIAEGMIGLPYRGIGTLAWEWDFAAADLIVHEAGGRYTDWHGAQFRYNKSIPRNFGGLVIANTPELHDRMLAAIAPLIPEIEADFTAES